ncbi:MAG: urea ABC transporter permease subunit UrtC, partial [Burkholderiales bacterium]|nr:urea ABC transporter permease subunit UrtC [Anaerolineae bacterium]
FVPQVGIISPKQLDIVASIEIVVWVAFGGRGSLIGAIIGAVLVNLGKSTISTSYPDIWQLLMGALFVGVVLVFPKGIVGSVSDLARRFGLKWNSPTLPLPGAVEPGLDVSETVSSVKG